MSGIDSVRGSSVNGLANGGDDRTSGSIPGPRSAADAYRVSDDEVQRARLVVAENSQDPDDLRLLLDMLGLVSANPDLPPPVCR
ncbi:hypothetical protein ACL02T_29470 [Pseudonocardia sp. RS010]|uniref:hypothetical protein n=1 Tax=Pseudonocardia sp. RS010 TaxID=3385979 RepID=UPI0039A2A453